VAARELTASEIANFTYSTGHYVRLKNRHRADAQ
jgi:hypothetical protein